MTKTNVYALGFDGRILANLTLPTAPIDDLARETARSLSVETEAATRFIKTELNGEGATYEWNGGFIRSLVRHESKTCAWCAARPSTDGRFCCPGCRSNWTSANSAALAR